MKIAGIIPARYASTRFPGKPLALILGKPMVVHTMRSAMESGVLSEVFVATDDTRIQQAVEQFGGKCIMTDKGLSSGTERCEAAISSINMHFDAVINIQGDEPFIKKSHLQAVAEDLKNGAAIASLAKPIKILADIGNPNVVKLVFNQQNKALYFSRHGIPFQRDQYSEHLDYYKHIGVYGYQKAVLHELVKLPESMLEQAESLEQLRWLDHGYDIHISITNEESIGVDTPEDLKRLENSLKHT